MKGATAAMFAVMADLAALPEPLPIKVRMVMVPDEESDEEKEIHATEAAVERGWVGDFVVCGEPTDFHVGVQAKGVLDVRLDVEGRSAHGATPWLGVNAIVRAMDVFDLLTTLPFAQESSLFYDRPSINLARIVGGDRLNRVPEHCSVEVDIRYLPEQPVDRLRAELQSLPGCTVKEIGWRPPAKVSTDNEFLKLLSAAANESVEHEVQCVGRERHERRCALPQAGNPERRVRARGLGPSRSCRARIDQVAAGIPACAAEIPALGSGACRRADWPHGIVATDERPRGAEVPAIVFGTFLFAIPPLVRPQPGTHL